MLFQSTSSAMAADLLGLINDENANVYLFMMHSNQDGLLKRRSHVEVKATDCYCSLFVGIGIPPGFFIDNINRSSLSACFTVVSRVNSPSKKEPATT